MLAEGNNDDDFNIFVGGKTGAFKGIKVNKKAVIVKNLHNVEILKPENEISILNWSDKKQSDILIGTANQMVKIYDSEYKVYSSLVEAKVGSGPIVGLSRLNGGVITCTQSGHIKVWGHKKTEALEFATGQSVSKMQTCTDAEGVVATGGENNDLKVWHLETKSKIFSAKNVKKDMLQLEVPIWISDLAFLPNNEYKIATCTKHGQVRLYDTKAQRRPVIDVNLENRSLTTISLCYKPNHVVVGSALGHILLVDLRCKGKILHCYKGAVGSIRQIATHPELPYVASVGLDRYLRIHHLETKKLLNQQYLKVRLNCVLMKSSFGKDIERFHKNEKKENRESEEENLESDEEYAEMFKNMESVKNDVEPAKKKMKI